MEKIKNIPLVHETEQGKYWGNAKLFRNMSIFDTDSAKLRTESGYRFLQMLRNRLLHQDKPLWSL